MQKNVIQDAKFSNKSVAKSAFKVTVGNVFTLIAGFGSQILIAALFGAGIEMDAYLTAAVVPVYVQAVLLGGLSFVFIPAFIRASMEDKEDDAWGLVGTFFWLTAGVLTLLALAGTIFAGEILQISAPGLSAAKSTLAENMLVIMMISIPFSGLATLTGGIQNARDRYFWPAMAPAIGAVGNLLTLIVLYQLIGPMALAWGFLVSVILRSAVTVIPVVRHGWSRLIPLKDKAVIEMFKLITPFIVFGLVTRSSDLFERFFASDFPDGELSYLGYANKIARIFSSLIRPGIAVAIFPAMARAYVKNGVQGLSDRTEFGTKLTFATSLPTIAIVSGVSVPLIMVLYERGAFVHTVTLSVSAILSFLILREVLFRTFGNVLVRGFYVTKDTRTPPMVTVGTTALYILFANVLVRASGYVGLAMAKPLSAVIGNIALSALLLNKLKFSNTKRLLKDIAIYLVASTIAFSGTWVMNSVTETLPALVRLIMAGGTGAGIYLFILSRVDREILSVILEMIGVNGAFRRLKLGYQRLARPMH